VTRARAGVGAACRVCGLAKVPRMKRSRPGRGAACNGAPQSRDPFADAVTAMGPGSAAQHSAALHAALRPGH